MVNDKGKEYAIFSMGNGAGDIKLLVKILSCVCFSINTAQDSTPRESIDSRPVIASGVNGRSL